MRREISKFPRSSQDDFFFKASAGRSSSAGLQVRTRFREDVREKTASNDDKKTARRPFFTLAYTPFVQKRISKWRRPPNYLFQMLKYGGFFT